MPRKRRPLLDRLLAKVSIDAETGCWNWTAGKSHDGYGAIGRGSRSEGHARAHRVSYELHCGPIPDGEHVCHRCDNRACVNPDHLFLGAPADNLADMTAKGRRARVGHRGTANPSAKLTEDDAIAIRTAVNVPWRDLAKRYGIGKTTVFGIRSGRIWSHLPRPPNSGDLL